MNHIFVRPALSADAEKFTKWSVETKDNLFDPETTAYPTTFTLCAYDGDGPIVYCPVQHPFFMEHLAINPDSSPLKVAQALKALVQAIVTQMHIKGVGETYFLCTEESTQKFAEHQAFTKMPWTVYRLKLSDTTK